MTDRSCLCVVLAAGEGTRMKSALPKVLHPIAGLPMVVHVMRAAEAAGGDLALVVGSGAEAVEAVARKHAPAVATYVQRERLGGGAGGRGPGGRGAGASRAGSSIGCALSSALRFWLRK